VSVQFLSSLLFIICY